jgi:universal stress protein E
MRRFKNILVYANSGMEPDPGVTRATKLASKNGASLVIVDAVEKVPAIVSAILPSSWNLQDAMSEDLSARLEVLAREARGAGVEVSTEVLVGKPSVEITRKVVKEGLDLVVKTARPEEREGAAAIGCVGVRLMRLCPCPVWVVQDSNAETDTRILAAVDPQTDDAAAAAMTVKVLQFAQGLAEDEDADLHVVHVWDLVGERMLRSHLPRDEFDAHRKAVKLGAKERLESLLKKAGKRPEDSNVHLLQGESGEVLVRFVE